MNFMLQAIKTQASRNLGFYIFFLCLNFTSFSVLANTALTKILQEKKSALFDLARSNEWKALLFYVPHLLGESSVIDANEFFLDPKGATDPYRELVSTIEMLVTPLKPDSLPDKHPICRFPARVDLIIKSLDISKKTLPLVTCSEYETWRKTFRARGVSLVFAANYLNNPASLFGHTFLHLYKQTPSERSGGSELTDWALNFAANPTSLNPLVYTVLGVTGGFKGSFSLMPYYLKVGEYNDFESRDLWEYYLNFSQHDVDKLLKSLWEVGPYPIDYFYFDENCSFIILLLLNAVRPEWHLDRGFPFAVAPSDTVKQVLRQQGDAQQIYFRPSSLKRFQYFLNQLTSGERRVLQKIIQKKNLSPLNQNTGESRQALIIDAGLEYLDYKDKSALLNEKGEFSALRLILLKKRAGIPTETSLDLSQIKAHSLWESPHIGPRAPHIAVQGVRDLKQDISQLEMSFRFSLHELSSHPRGYGSNLEMIMGDFAFRAAPGEENMHLYHYTLFRVFSAPHYDDFIKPLSWQLNISGGRNLLSDKTINHEVIGGVGYSLWPSDTLGFSWLVNLGANLEPGNLPKGLVGIKHLGSLAISEYAKLSYELFPLWVPTEEKYYLRGGITSAYILHDKMEWRVFYNKTLTQEVGCGVRLFF